MALFSRLKASTGRLVRMMSEGDTEPADFGAVAADTAADSYLDDPHLRHFLGRYIVEFVERAFEPPSTAQIREALQVMGRPLSERDITELIETDLQRKITLNEHGRWDIDARMAEDDAREKKARAEQRAEREAEERKARASRPRTADRKLSVEEARSILTITPATDRDEAQKTYRKLLMRYHPDKFHDDEEFRTLAEEKAKAINLAWDVMERHWDSGGE
jgi:hypothetical protein